MPNPEHGSHSAEKGTEMTVPMPQDINATGSTPTDVAMLKDRHKQIAVNAYFRAERRGFQPGHELDDWLAAEEEIERANRPLPSY